MPARLLRHVLCVLLAGAAAIVPTACGGGADADAVGERTRAITDATGTRVEVPVLPQRVVTLGEPALDSAFALGLRPIATTTGRDGVAAYLDERARGTIVVGALGRPDVEHVEALEPDLILLDGTAVPDRATLDRLRDLAPTAYVSKPGQDWRTAFTAEADALNRQAEGAHALHEFDARVRQVRDALGDHAGAEISVAAATGGGRPSALTDALAADSVLAALGLERRRDLRGNPVFLDGPGAVRGRHVVPVDRSAWASAGGPIAMREVVDDVARALTPESG